jgi:diguanylate cyclase (GGDEF)-like protein
MAHRASRIVLWIAVGVAIIVALSAWSIARLELLQGLPTSAKLLLVASSLLLVAVLLLYQRLHRQEREDQAVAVEARISEEARQAEARAHQLELLLRLSRALNASMDADAMKATITSQLPNLAGTSDIWMTSRLSGWTFEIGSPPPGMSFGGTPAAGAWEMFPLVAGGRNVGVLGIRQPAMPFSEPERRTLEIVASMLAVSIRNAQLFKRIRDFSMYDPLTGCLTRHQGVEMLLGAMRRANRTKSALSIVLFDLDFFKQLNDEYGHLTGDQALVAVGRILKKALRVSDYRCRFGGEEFLVILPDTGLAGAVHVAEDLRRRLLATKLQVGTGSIALAASFGVTDVDPSEQDVKTPIARADQALYGAKRSGRNRVVATPATGGSKAPMDQPANSIPT